MFRPPLGLQLPINDETSDHTLYRVLLNIVLGLLLQLAGDIQ
jgi:hypothetical protein